MSEVVIVARGPVGSGKSAVLGEIEIALKAIGLTVRYANEEEAATERSLTHADWISELDQIKPEIRLVEGHFFGKICPNCGRCEDEVVE